MNIFIGELVGTAILVLLGNGVVANVVLNKSKGQNSGWIVITFGWGMAVMVAVYVTGWMSGAHINPAVTIGLASIGALELNLVPVYLAGQFIGAFIGSILVWMAYGGHWEATEDADGKLACFSTGPAIRNYPKNLMTEIIGTAMLMIGILGITSAHNNLGSGIAPLLVGLLVFSLGLSLGGPTGYAINPVRDLGPRIMHAILPIAGKRDSDWAYAWVPVVGPIIGGVSGAFIYNIVISYVVK